MNLLFFRGDFDKNNELNLYNDTDVWIQLFHELAGDGNGCVWYRGKDRTLTYKSRMIYVQKEFPIVPCDYIFARGGFDWYISALKFYRDVFKIYYGAGIRIKPKDGIRYDKILVDTNAQKEAIGKDAVLWTKPAAECFKPVFCQKEYDVCYIANPASDNQAEFKRIKWVYKTVPKDLKVLHLGNSWKFKPPKNVTVKRLDRNEMAAWISKCRIGICPYKGYDSAPRALIEMNACGLRVVCLEVNIQHGIYKTVVATKDNLWDVCRNTKHYESFDTGLFSVKSSAEQLLKEICSG